MKAFTLMLSMRAASFVALCMWALCGLAEAAKPVTPVAPAEVVSPGSMLQFALGLAVVLALIVATGWVMKRSTLGKSASGMIKVVAAAAVGQRERVVIVELADVRMILGVAPGQVTALHTIPLAEARKHEGDHAGAAAELKAWLQESRRAN